MSVMSCFCSSVERFSIDVVILINHWLCPLFTCIQPGVVQVFGFSGPVEGHRQEGLYLNRSAGVSCSTLEPRMVISRDVMCVLSVL